MKSILLQLSCTHVSVIYGKLFEKDKNNSKKTWDHINDLLDGRKSAHKEFKIDKIEYMNWMVNKMK